MFLLPFAGKGKMFEITVADLCNGVVLPASTLTITGEAKSAFSSMELLRMAYGAGLGRSRNGLK
jgi:hypothetical protein